MMKWIRNNLKLDKREWHLWFAWKPVIVFTYPDGNNKVVWFEIVLRKFILEPGNITPGPPPCWKAIYKEKVNNSNRFKKPLILNEKNEPKVEFNSESISPSEKDDFTLTLPSEKENTETPVLSGIWEPLKMIDFLYGPVYNEIVLPETLEGIIHTDDLIIPEKEEKVQLEIVSPSVLKEVNRARHNKTIM